MNDQPAPLSSAEIDPQISELIPHRPPMLLIQRLHQVTTENAQASVRIADASPFVEGDLGVPAWIGLEYMGQTAALIAGYQTRQGLCQEHLGFLLGCREYTAHATHFAKHKHFLINAQQETLVGESLATFRCTIQDQSSEEIVAQALLSVFRQPKQEISIINHE